MPTPVGPSGCCRRDTLDPGVRRGDGGRGVAVSSPLSRFPASPPYSTGAAVSSYRLSFLYKVEGSIPRTSAARVLFPPSACSTHMM